MIRCTRRLQFCCGHRVVEHESKCRNLHGHNYVAYFHARRADDTLDALGRVIDFSVLKERIGGWIDEHWDHGLVLWDADPMLASLPFEDGQKVHHLFANPTAENMALYLLYDVCPDVLRGTGIEVDKVVLWETENCFAEASL